MRPTADLPAGFWRVLTVVGAARAAQFVEPFLPLLLLGALGAAPAVAAAVLLAQQAAAVAGFLVVGWLTNRLGVAVTLRLGLVTAAGAAGVLASASSLGSVAAAAVCYGLGSAVWRASAQALVPLSLAVPRVRSSPGGGHVGPALAGGDASLRARAFGLFVAASNAGAVLSAAAGALGGPIRVLLAVQAVGMGLGLALSVRLRGIDGPRRGAGRGRRPRLRWRSTAGRAGDPVGGSPGLWLLVAAVAPTTVLMFQAFSGLAVLLTTAQYRIMVLVNAVVLVAAQPVVGWALRRVSAAVSLGAASVGLGVGLALQALNPAVVALTAVWTVAELVVIIVPSAVVAGLAPHPRLGGYVGWFQAAQGGVAAAAMYAGPVLAGSNRAGFAAACVVLAVLGLAGAAAARGPLHAAMRQPVDCPCGALLCGCDGAHHACASPTPVLVHAGSPARRMPAAESPSRDAQPG